MGTPALGYEYSRSSTADANARAFWAQNEQQRKQDEQHRATLIRRHGIVKANEILAIKRRWQV
jgi:hypothetical protein